MGRDASETFCELQLHITEERRNLIDGRIQGIKQCLCDQWLARGSQ